MAMQHDKQFKLDAIQYYQDHKDLGVRGCAENLGIGYSTLTKWLKDFRESGDILARGSGNYASDEQKEIARLRRELRDAQDAHLDNRRICLSDQYYGFIFQKNHSLDTFRNIGSILRDGYNKQSQRSPKYRPAINHSLRSWQSVCCNGI